MQTCVAPLRESVQPKRVETTLKNGSNRVLSDGKAADFTKSMHLLPSSTSEHDVFSVFDVLLDVKSPERFRTPRLEFNLLKNSGKN